MLVVTIVVLLILAGITLTYVFGDNSIFKQASNAKLETELAKIEERARMIYSDKLLENVSSLNSRVETSSVIEQLRNEGYTIEEKTVSVDDITGINLDKESMTMALNETKEIEVTFEGVEEPFIYYVEVEEKYYQMYSNKGLITVNREPSSLSKMELENEEIGSLATLIITSSDETVVTAAKKKGSNNIIEVTSKEVEGDVEIIITYGSYEKTCKVKVVRPVLTTSITLNETSYTITGGNSWTNDLQLIATLKPDNVTEEEVSWISSNPEIATVDDKGLVKAGKKGGDVTIIATTKDGTNLSTECKITSELFSEIKANKMPYTDSEGNIAQIPGGFAVGTSENVNKVTGGLVIQDNEGNQFVWIPVGEFKNKSGGKDNISLGRYEFNANNGIPTLKQNADNYVQNVIVEDYFQEKISTPRDLEGFATKTKANGGYYLARYETSKGSNDRTKSQYDKTVWTKISQDAAMICSRDVYRENNYIESDLVNSYAWDTAIVFIQKYSGNSNYANKTSANLTQLKTGRSGDKVCNIYDIASNCFEWSTEFSSIYGNAGTFRGGSSGNNYMNDKLAASKKRAAYMTYGMLDNLSFRSILYFI